MFKPSDQTRIYFWKSVFLLHPTQECLRQNYHRNSCRYLQWTHISSMIFHKKLGPLPTLKEYIKTSKNSLIKKFASSFNLLVLITTNFSNPFHGQTSLKDIIFSFVKSGVRFSLISLRNALIDVYFLIPQYIQNRIGKVPNILSHT